MISLENIRNRSGLLLVVIGFAMMAFILTDLLSSRNGGAVSTDLVIGQVGDNEIDYQLFEKKVQESLEAQRRSNPNIDIAQVRNSVWNQLVRESILNNEFEALGVEVCASELFDMVQGNNPYPTVKQSFVNPQTGQFDRSRLLQFLKEDINNDETGEAKKQWLTFEEAIRNERRNNKYNALISKGLSVSDWEARLSKVNQSEIRNVSYIQIPFQSIPDSLVTISDSDLKSYINDNSASYQQENSRGIEYVVYPVSPSEEDRADAQAWIEDIKTDFLQTEDDELFVRKNSDVFNRVLYVDENDLSENTKPLLSSEVGSVVGPFKQGFNTLRLAKLVDKSMRPDSVEARHILISSADAESKIDSLKNLIIKGQSFVSLAETYSEDQGSATKGGDLGWFAEGQMVNEFNEACFSANKGELVTVNTQFGTHLIEIVDKSKSVKKYKIAYLDRQVLYSNSTYQEVFAKAGKFAAENSTYEEFNESSIAENLSKRVADDLQENTVSIPGLENPRELVRWAYEAKIGDVSDVFEFADKIVVATLTTIKKEGLKDLEDVRAEVETIVLNNKKSEQLLSELTDYNSLEDIVSNYGSQIKTVEGLNFSSSQVPSLGNEPAFVGAAFAVEESNNTSICS